MIFLIYLLLSFGYLFSFNNNFHSLDNNFQHYYWIEYELFKKDLNKVFIFHQPYATQDIQDIFKDENSRFDNEFSSDKEFNFFIKPGLSSNGSKVLPHPYFNISSYVNFDESFLKIEAKLDKTLSEDLYFHGDKDEIFTGYINEAFLYTKLNELNIFAGRLSRNFGIINEYSLIFSNNPFPFDHYGFSLTGKKTKFSFYVSRLNNYNFSIDSQGIVIPLDSTVTSKRFFSFQHIDFKIDKNIQLALSQSIIYGGPNQTFEGLYLNPMNFFYASQRNSKVQMNTLWQLLMGIKINDKSMFYIDFLIDDFIVNNDESDERDKYPDRLGLTLKYSSRDLFFDKTLTSLTFTSISNDTYTSFRNYENYFYELKGIGFPYNSFQSLKLLSVYFLDSIRLLNTSITLSQKGDNNIFNIFENNKTEFPFSPILYSLDSCISISTLFQKKIKFFYEFRYRFESNKKTLDNFETIINHKFEILYEI